MTAMTESKDRLRRAEWAVEVAPLEAAQKMVRDHHYAKGGSNTAVYVHGLYHKESEKLFGVAWWLPPTRVAAESVNKHHWKQVLSLTRLVCLPDAPQNAASFLIAGSIKLINADGRFCSLVTYADEARGHSGAIYRATNWEYVGRTGPYPRWECSKTGRQVSPKSTVNRTKSQMEALGHIKTGSFHKHKFVKHLWSNPHD